MVRVRRTYLARRPESRLPSASGTHSMQEAGTRSPYTTQYGGSGAFLSAQHAAAVRALARRGEACMRRGRELPRRPAVGRRVHAPPRAPAVHVHPQCCGREAAPNETVSLRARSCQHGAAGMFGATIVGQVASAFCRVSRQQRASPPALPSLTRACPCRRLSSRAALAAHASRAARVRVPATPSTPTSRSAATAGTAAGHCSPRTVRCPLPAARCALPAVRCPPLDLHVPLRQARTLARPADAAAAAAAGRLGVRHGGAAHPAAHLPRRPGIPHWARTPD